MKSEIRPLVIAPNIAPIVNIAPNVEYCHGIEIFIRNSYNMEEFEKRA